MKTSITNIIHSREDKEYVPNEWLFLVAPLIKIIDSSPTSHLNELYVKTTSTTYILPFTDFINTQRLELSDKREPTIRNYRSLLCDNFQKKPVVIIGEPGIGKTTWINHFFEYSIKKHLKNNTIEYYIYDHHQEAGNPFGHTDKIIRMRRRIAYETTRIVKAKCEIFNVDHGLLEIDLDTIESSMSENSSFLDLLGLANKIKQSVNDLKELGVDIWIVIDNLDMYSDSEQRNGFKIANSLSRSFNINSILTMRPYTYTHLRRCLDGNILTLKPPSLYAVILKRIEYLKNIDQNKAEDVFDIKKHLDLFNSVGLDLTWAKNISSISAIYELYEAIAETITANRTLVRMLENIRHYNVRRSLEDVSSLMKCGYFAKIFTKELESMSDDEHKKSDWQIITAYLRGPYKRHHGRTHDYQLNITNIFDITGNSYDHMLLGVRVLQILNKCTSADKMLSMKYEVLTDRLTYFGYPLAQVKNTIEFLIRRRLIRNITIAKDHLDDVVTPKDQDYLAITFSGTYYIKKFLKKYALRYCEAMADVTLFPSNYFNNIENQSSVFKVKKDFFSVLSNCLLLLDEVHKVLKNEIGRLSDITSDSGDYPRLREFMRELDNDEGFFYGIMTNITDVISGVVSSGYKINESDTKIIEKANNLNKAAKEIYNMKSIYVAN